jgi:hypothetical protein
MIINIADIATAASDVVGATPENGAALEIDNFNESSATRISSLVGRCL